jgi:polysaccharide biosynthesis transport protein
VTDFGAREISPASIGAAAPLSHEEMTARALPPGRLWRGFLLFLRRNSRRILLLATFISPAFFAASIFFLQRYSATAVVMLDPRSVRVIDRAAVLENIGSDVNAIESMVQVTKSEGFAGAVVDRLKLTQSRTFAGQGGAEEIRRQSTIRNLADYLSVTRRGTTYVIDFTVRSSSATESARLANGAAQQLIDDQTALRSGLSSVTARELSARLVELRTRVNNAERAAAEYKAQIKLTDAGQGGTLLERRLSELNQQIILAASRKAEARARYDLLRSIPKGSVERLPQDAQSGVLSALSSELARLLKMAADQGAVLGPRHPEMVRLNSQIANVRGQIAGEVARLTLVARSDFAESEQREAELTRELKHAMTESDELGPQQVKLKQLEREAEAERGVYEAMLRRQRELVEANGLEPNDLRLVSAAVAPQKPIPGTGVLAAGSVGLGLLAGTLLSALAERRRPTLRTRAQAEDLVGDEPVAFLPWEEAGAERRSGRRKGPDLTPWLSGVCRGLTGAGNSVVLFVSSAKRGEGRSTVAANLAVFLSRGGDRVLLIEADRGALRKKPRRGLLDVLRSGENLQSALLFRATGGYAVLPYGQPAGPDETGARQGDIGGLMSGATLRALLKVSRAWFDVIVIDGPPALEAPYSRFLAAQADRTILVVEWDKTTSAEAEQTFDVLEAQKATVVFNKTRLSRLRLYDPEPARQLGDDHLAA